MPTITQTIPNYIGGISEQPDQLKVPGQVKSVQNAIPDVTYGLYKRPGAKRIGTAPLTNVQSGGSWFHYYRDETEGSYIGQVAADGRVRIWSCNDGTEKNVWYHTDNSAYSGGNSDHTAITTYLSASNTEDVQALTINDTTFLTNRDTTVATTGTTTARPHNNFAYVELRRTENGRQYSMNVYDDTSTQTLKRATALKIQSDNLAEGSGSGGCEGIGTQVFYVDSGSSKNLIFRITALGQQGKSDSGDGAAAYKCTYNRELTLLHGGEDWEDGDTCGAALDQAKTTYNYTIEVEDHEEVDIQANVKAVRPRPTPFDADTAVTVDTILGGITSELTGVTVNGNALNYKVIGNGIYLWTAADADDFNVEIVDQDLMTVMQSQINDVTKLPLQCKHGVIVKIANTRMSDEDDYYVKFHGTNDKDGSGSWIECAAPGIVKSFDANTMPHVLQRQADGDFLVKKYGWADREIGDNLTNPIPSFVGEKINKTVFHRNRLVFLAGENVITSRPGTIETPNFWSNSALTVSAIDPIDISCASTYPSALYEAIEINTGLLCFSTNQQFLLASDDTIMNPDTAKLRSVSMYNYNKVIPPISLGRTTGYIDNSNKYSRFMEMADIVREGEPLVVESSKLIPSTIPKDIDLIANSRENNVVLLGKTDSDTVVCYRYYRQADKLLQSAWFKWKFNNPLKYHFCIEDEYFLLDTDNFLQKVNLIQADTDPSVDQDSINYLIHLDNYTTVTGGVFNPTTNITTFTHGTDSCVFSWQSSVTSPNGTLVLVDSNSNSDRLGRYAECTVTGAGSTFTIPGNWDYTTEHVVPYTALNASNEQITVSGGHGFSTGDEIKWVEGDTAAGGLTDGTTYFVISASTDNIALASSLSNANAGVAVNITSQGTGNHKIRLKTKSINIGYLYEYSVEFPRFYLQKQQGEIVSSDINSKLTVHRIKLNFGKIGLYETTLTRIGKTAYTEVYESTDLDEYDASDAPYLEEKIKDIPVYERNTNVNVTLKSSHPAPATLRAMSWEADWSPMHYRRV